MICKILGLLVNRLIADDKYSLLNCEELRQPIQMQLFKKQKTFSECFFAFLKFRSNFELFEKKMSLIAYVFPKLGTAKDVIRQMCKKSRFGRPLDKRRGKRSQTLLKSPQLHFYHIH